MLSANPALMEGRNLGEIGCCYGDGDDVKLLAASDDNQNLALPDKAHSYSPPLKKMLCQKLSSGSTSRSQASSSVVENFGDAGELYAELQRERQKNAMLLGILSGSALKKNAQFLDTNNQQVVEEDSGQTSFDCDEQPIKSPENESGAEFDDDERYETLHIYSPEICNLRAYDYLEDGRKIYIINLHEKCRGKELLCKDVLKKVGCCGCHFLWCSKIRPHMFYARLKKNEAAKLPYVKGVFQVLKGSEVLIDC